MYNIKIIKVMKKFKDLGIGIIIGLGSVSIPIIMSLISAIILH